MKNAQLNFVLASGSGPPREPSFDGLNQHVEDRKSQRPEWLRVSDAVRIYSLSRSKIFELLSDGEIKSVSLRKRGNVRGARRILTSSIDDYFARHANEGPSI
jgi:hypothetical protein